MKIYRSRYICFIHSMLTMALVTVASCQSQEQKDLDDGVAVGNEAEEEEGNVAAEGTNNAADNNAENNYANSYNENNGGENYNNYNQSQNYEQGNNNVQNPNANMFGNEGNAYANNPYAQNEGVGNDPGAGYNNAAALQNPGAQYALENPAYEVEGQGAVQPPYEEGNVPLSSTPGQEAQLFSEENRAGGNSYQGTEPQFNAAATAPVTEEELRVGPDGVILDGSASAVARPDSNFLTSQIPDGRSHDAPTLPSVLGGEEEEAVEQQAFVELLPVTSRLVWVGYDYRPEESQVRIEMVTDGSPKYSLFTTKNRYSFPEVVVRFYQTDLRGRMLRDMDASEFGAPVSYIRTYFNELEYSTDVVLTLRESTPMRLYVHEGNLLATFPISEKYYGNHAVGGDAEVEYAQVVDDSPMFAEFLASSQFPRGQNPYDLTGGAFEDAPADGGEEVLDESMEVKRPAYSDNGLPVQDFDNNAVMEQEDGYSSGDNSYPYNSPNTYIPSDSNSDTSFPSTHLSYVQYAQSLGFSWVSRGHLVAVAQNEANTLAEEPPPGNARLPVNATIEAINPAAVPLPESTNLPPAASAANPTAPAAPSTPAPAYNTNSPELFDNANIPPDASAPIAAPLVTEEYVDVSSAETGGYDTPNEALISQSAGAPVHPVNLEFRDASLADVIRILGKENNINFIYDFNAHSAKKVTMFLQNVSWTDALKAVLEVHNLDYTRLAGDVIQIDTAKEIKKRFLQAPTKIFMSRLSYMKAEDAGTIISGFLKSRSANAAKTLAAASESTPGPSSASTEVTFNVSSDSRTNTLIVEAPESELSVVKTLIERLDSQTPQVRIDARIIEVQKNQTNAYGIDWSLPQFGAPLPTGGLGIGDLGLGGDFKVQAPVDASAANLRLNLASLTNVGQIELALQWQETHLGARILQNSSVLVLNNETATIESGLEDTIVPNFVRDTGDAGGSGGIDIEYLLSLEVTPQVTSDGSVTMEVTVTSTDPVAGAGQNRRATKSVETFLIRESGQTAAIAGIYTQSETDNERRVPLLSKVPIIGWIFKNSTSNLDKKEIVILLTPTIVNDAFSRSRTTSVGEVASLEQNYQNYQNYGQNNNNYNNYDPGYQNASQNTQNTNNYYENEYENNANNQAYNQNYNNNNQSYNQNYNNNNQSYNQNYEYNASYNSEGEGNTDNYYNNNSYEADNLENSGNSNYNNDYENNANQ